ncbi:MAG: IDEAL domain-containing protein [Caryophanon sp.]|nr:IDEAL domain-containing protein [Caryophanon sp.]
MDKFYSYTDFLRAINQTSQHNDAEKLLNEIYLDLFLQRLQREQRLDKLRQAIDESLQVRNEQAFKEYTSEYIALQAEE